MKQAQVIVLLLFNVAGFSQGIPRNERDCHLAHAYDLSKSLPETFNVIGYGEMEISDSSTPNLYAFKEEHNMQWVKVRITGDGTFSFRITPANTNGDLDFLVFKADGPDFCSKVKARSVKPVRTNLARVASGMGGKTGLSETASNAYVSSGPGDQFSKAIQVKKDEEYYIAIDYYTKGGGRFTFSAELVPSGEAPNDFKAPEPEPAKQKAPVDLQKADLAPRTVPMTVKVVDDETGSPVKASLVITGVKDDAVRVDTSMFTASLGSSQTVRINCNAKGYMFASHDLIGPVIDHHDPSQAITPVNVELRLKKIKPGDKVALRNIQFQPDKAEFHSASWGELQSLTKFLEANPDVKIEIGGHINGPDGSSRAGKQMSKKRAKAVYDYLLKRGIDKGRLKYKGYGNSQMIYPKPENEHQAEMNRRVEVKIVSE